MDSNSDAAPTEPVNAVDNELTLEQVPADGLDEQQALKILLALPQHEWDEVMEMTRASTHAKKLAAMQSLSKTRNQVMKTIQKLEELHKKKPRRRYAKQLKFYRKMHIIFNDLWRRFQESLAETAPPQTSGV